MPRLNFRESMPRLPGSDSDRMRLIDAWVKEAARPADSQEEKEESSPERPYETTEVEEDPQQLIDLEFGVSALLSFSFCFLSSLLTIKYVFARHSLMSVESCLNL